MKRLRHKPIVAVALVVGCVGGPTFAHLVFPDVSITKQVVGGLVAGFYFAMCAVPEHFLDL